MIGKLLEIVKRSDRILREASVEAKRLENILLGHKIKGFFLSFGHCIFCENQFFIICPSHFNTPLYIEFRY